MCINEIILSTNYHYPFSFCLLWLPSNATTTVHKYNLILWFQFPTQANTPFLQGQSSQNVPLLLAPLYFPQC